MGSLILLLLIVGVVLALVPIDGTIKNIIIVIVLIAVLLSLFGGGGGFNHGWNLRW